MTSQTVKRLNHILWLHFRVTFASYDCPAGTESNTLNIPESNNIYKFLWVRPIGCGFITQKILYNNNFFKNFSFFLHVLKNLCK